MWKWLRVLVVQHHKWVYTCKYLDEIISQTIFLSMYIYIYVKNYIYIYIHTYIYVFICSYVFVYIYIIIHTYICLYIHKCIYVYICMIVFMLWNKSHTYVYIKEMSEAAGKGASDCIWYSFIEIAWVLLAFERPPVPPWATVAAMGPWAVRGAPGGGGRPHSLGPRRRRGARGLGGRGWCGDT